MHHEPRRAPPDRVRELPTILVFKNALDWLAGDADFATCALPFGAEKKKKKKKKL